MTLISILPQPPKRCDKGQLQQFFLSRRFPSLAILRSILYIRYPEYSEYWTSRLVRVFLFLVVEESVCVTVVLEGVICTSSNRVCVGTEFPRWFRCSSRQEEKVKRKRVPVRCRHNHESELRRRRRRAWVFWQLKNPVTYRSLPRSRKRCEWEYAQVPASTSMFQSRQNDFRHGVVLFCVTLYTQKKGYPF